ncbi:hemerythrin domain-containing protein [Salimicrobium halophilum]|uniref:Hemerythrin HHE cation binding domain-containing protein n=1 Tax=Salimicrobium halophilum TaxID=86666 RepID=A0A1G8TIL8_9BACI|nr:hemerythrin domain-containing protein [Salimicrobium halophilum]SDJ41237.1 Hemerythrin HHE cation binding domain-containing protein [Salimicrobium halophilum]
MKRHEALIPLSHHHHHGLVLAQKLKKVEEKDKFREFMKEIDAFWEKDGRAHFREEEEILVPLYSCYASIEDDSDIQKMLTDHAEIRGLIKKIKRTERYDHELFKELGEKLHDHIRLEERVIFPKMEAAIPDKELYKAEGQFHIDSHSGR